MCLILTDLGKKKKKIAADDFRDSVLYMDKFGAEVFKVILSIKTLLREPLVYIKVGFFVNVLVLFVLLINRMAEKLANTKLLSRSTPLFCVSIELQQQDV